MPETVGPFRLVIPVMPPTRPEGVELELDHVFIEGVQSPGVDPEGAAADRQGRDDDAMPAADRGIVTRR